MLVKQKNKKKSFPSFHLPVYACLHGLLLELQDLHVADFFKSMYSMYKLYNTYYVHHDGGITGVFPHVIKWGQQSVSISL